MDYKNELIKMIKNIKHEWVLKYLYQFAKEFINRFD
jgi:hypothetical protein